MFSLYELPYEYMEKPLNVREWSMNLYVLQFNVRAFTFCVTENT